MPVTLPLGRPAAALVRGEPSPPHQPTGWTPDRPPQTALCPEHPCRLGLRVTAGAAGHRQGVAGRHRPGGRTPGPARPGDGDAVRAHLPGLAGGVPADRPARPVLLLRGVRAHRRLDGEPARQVAQGEPAPGLAAAHPVAELPAHLARVAAGPQRLLPPGPRLHRPRDEQEGRGRPGLPATRREHPAVGGRPLPAQPRLRQRHRGRQAAGTHLAGHGRGGAALARGDWASGTGPPTTTATRTWCWPPPATYPPSRCSRPPTCCASTCPT